MESKTAVISLCSSTKAQYIVKTIRSSNNLFRTPRWTNKVKWGWFPFFFTPHSLCVILLSAQLELTLLKVCLWSFNHSLSKRVSNQSTICYVRCWHTKSRSVLCDTAEMKNAKLSTIVISLTMSGSGWRCATSHFIFFLSFCHCLYCCARSLAGSVANLWGAMSGLNFGRRTLCPVFFALECFEGHWKCPGSTWWRLATHCSASSSNESWSCEKSSHAGLFHSAAVACIHALADPWFSHSFHHPRPLIISCFSLDVIVRESIGMLFSLLNSTKRRRHYFSIWLLVSFILAWHLQCSSQCSPSWSSKSTICRRSGTFLLHHLLILLSCLHEQLCGGSGPSPAYWREEAGRWATTS